MDCLHGAFIKGQICFAPKLPDRISAELLKLYEIQEKSD